MSKPKSSSTSCLRKRSQRAHRTSTSKQAAHPRCAYVVGSPPLGQIGAQRRTLQDWALRMMGKERFGIFSKT